MAIITPMLATHFVTAQVRLKSTSSSELFGKDTAAAVRYSLAEAGCKVTPCFGLAQALEARIALCVSVFGK